MDLKPPNITKYFLHGDALIEFIRKESGLPPLGRDKEYKDYVRDARQREFKKLKILSQNKIMRWKIQWKTKQQI